jgi:leucyl aminopeptidase
VEVGQHGESLSRLDADVHAIALPDGAQLPDELTALAGADDVRTGSGKLTLLRGERPARLLVAGLGPADEVDAEALRVAAARVAKEAAQLEARTLAWAVPELPEVSAVAAAAALTEGTILASYRFDRFRSDDSDEPKPRLERLAFADAADPAIASAVDVARVAATAANRARELQHLPANHATPSFLAARAEEIAAAHDAVEATILGPEEIAERGMGGIVAVSQGTAEEPRLICLRYRGRGDGEVLGLVGKAVTFDSGGISIKPSQGMQDMKMDMSGGAAVLEAMAAIAELGLELDVVAVVPSTENLPSGTAVKPGDIITQLNGKTVEVNNTDAEGRLILADALTWCATEMGADRLVDLATLTGAVLIALGSTYAALISNDDEWAARVSEAAERTGELAWRLPLHPEYKELTRGKVADLVNSAAKRKAGTIYAGSFLEEFVEGKPWAHVDIAGTSWDVGRAYVGSGPTGYGVRLLVDLARELAG